MKRMFIFTVIISFLLIGYSAVAAAPDPGVPTGKALYSSRPARPAKSWADSVPANAPIMAPVPVPDQSFGGNVEQHPASGFVLRDEPVSIPSAPMPPVPTLQSKPKQPILEFSDLSFDELNPPPSSSRNSVPQPISQPVPQQRPLSVISIEQKTTPTLAPPQFTSAPASAPKPVQTNFRTNVQDSQIDRKIDDIDSFNARLAKIQLEKHNLTETLELIGKIKSAPFKVKTLVDLAEYVSRDSNYKKEAEQLYALSVDGINALVNGNPIAVKMKDGLKGELKTEPVSSPPTSVPKTPMTFSEPKKPETPTAPSKPALTLVEEDTPTPAPKLESATQLAPKPAEPAISLDPAPTPAPKKLVITLDEEEPAKAVPPTPASPPALPEKKATPSLIDEPEKKETLSEKIGDIQKETTSTAPLTLPMSKPTEKAAEEPAEKIEPKAPSKKRPSILLNDESADDEAKTESQPADSAAPKRRPMPGKKVTLEEN